MAEFWLGLLNAPFRILDSFDISSVFGFPPDALTLLDVFFYFSLVGMTISLFVRGANPRYRD